ncbi:hypothetical protein TNCV_2534851 [Trichonephila clavipes]|nr:hypothetical protein TNCV_2534851 [Trichonephila clavipes]
MPDEEGINNGTTRNREERVRKSLSPWSRCSRVIKVSDRGLPCHEFEPSTTKDPPYSVAMHVKSVESSNVLSLVLRCRPRHLTLVQTDVCVAKSPRVAEQCDVNIQSINQPS